MLAIISRDLISRASIQLGRMGRRRAVTNISIMHHLNFNFSGGKGGGLGELPFVKFSERFFVEHTQL